MTKPDDYSEPTITLDERESVVTPEPGSLRVVVELTNQQFIYVTAAGAVLLLAAICLLVLTSVAVALAISL